VGLLLVGLAEGGDVLGARVGLDEGARVGLDEEK